METTTNFLKLYFMYHTSSVETDMTIDGVLGSDPCHALTGLSALTLKATCFIYKCTHLYMSTT